MQRKEDSSCCFEQLLTAGQGGSTSVGRGGGRLAGHRFNPRSSSQARRQPFGSAGTVPSRPGRQLRLPERRAASSGPKAHRKGAAGGRPPQGASETTGEPGHRSGRPNLRSGGLQHCAGCSTAGGGVGDVPGPSAEDRLVMSENLRRTYAAENWVQCTYSCRPTKQPIYNDLRWSRRSGLNR